MYYVETLEGGAPGPTDCVRRWGHPPQPAPVPKVHDRWVAVTPKMRIKDCLGYRENDRSGLLSVVGEGRGGGVHMVLRSDWDDIC